MSKTITLRIEDDTYKMFKTAASGMKRSISNFIEVATISYISQETYVADQEMSEILSDHDLLDNLNSGKKEIDEGKFRIVE